MIYKILLPLSLFAIGILININIFANSACLDDGKIVYTIPPTAWINSKKPIGYEIADWIKVPFHQVAHTKQYLAVKELETKNFIKLTEDDARYYTGKYYQSKSNTSPYLVRGLFDNPSGRFFAGWWEKENHLEINFSSLGKGGEVMFSPLIVQLPTKPKTLSVTVSGAM